MTPVFTFLRLATVLVLVSLSVAACGQKGPLYLPGNGPDGPAGAQQQDSTPAESTATPGR